MKKRIFVLLLLILPAMLVSSQNKGKQKKKPTTVELKTFTDSVSYLIGADVAGNLKQNNIEINNEMFFKGFEHKMNNADSVMSDQEKQKVMTKLQTMMQGVQQKKQSEELQKNKFASQQFLLSNKVNPGVIELPSGLQYKVIKLGTGPKPLATDEVEVHYEGKLIDGKIFDSSYERGESISFPLNGVIKGWTEGVQLMPTGSIFELFIPSDLAYGDQGNSGIPGGATLIFKVELISIKSK